MFRRVTEGLRSVHQLGCRMAATIVLLTFSVSALRVAFNIGHSIAVSSPDYQRCIRVSWAEWSLSFVDMHLLGITIGLLISCAGLWSRTGAGFLASFFGLVWSCVSYLAWHAGTLSIMRANNISDFSQLQLESQHLLALTGATLWDVGVAIVILLMLIWQVKTFIVILRTPSY